MEKTESEMISREKEGKRQAFRISWKRTLLEVLILAGSGAAMTLAFAPVNRSFFAWICVIPLIWICARRSARRTFFYGFLWGYAWHFTGIFFLREICWFIPFFFAGVLAIFNAVFACLIPPLFHNLLYPAEIRKAAFAVRGKFYRYPAWTEIAASFTLASLWVLLEWIRSWIFTGFPWNLLAASQWQNLSLIQICEYTGIYALSFLVIFINVSGYFAIHGFRYSLPEGKYKRPWALYCGIVLCILANSLGVSLFKRVTKEYRGNALIPYAAGVIQPCLSQRRDGGNELTREALDVCLNLSGKLIADEQMNIENRRFLTMPRRSVDMGEETPADREMKKDFYPLHLIVWPETAVPAGYYLNDEFGQSYRASVRKMLSAFPQVSFLIGTIEYGDFLFGAEGEILDWKSWNSALFLKANPPDRRKFDYDRAGFYRKVHLVPFGEFVPLAKTFPVLEKWVGMGRSLSPGKGFVPMELVPGVRAGVLICYEDVFSYPAQEYARSGANVLIDITNDAWYPESSEPEQHYINSLFRVIETRLPMLRCGNADYSVLIDATGRLADSIFKTISSDGKIQYHPGRKGRGCGKFIVPVPRKPIRTFYMAYGDWFVLLCGAVFAAGVILAAVRAVFFAHALNDPFEEERRRIRAGFLGGPGNSGADPSVSATSSTSDRKK